MFVSMTAILATGVCVLVIIFFTQSHRASQQLASLRVELDSNVRSVLIEDTKIEQQLIRRLIDGADTRQSVDKYRVARAALLPGAGPKWNEQMLAKRKQEDADRQATEIRQKAFYTTAIALVLTVFIFAGATLAVYSACSSSKSPNQFPAPITSNRLPHQSVNP